MGNILLLSKNTDLNSRYRNIFGGKYFDFDIFENQNDLYNKIENTNTDVLLADINMENIEDIVQKVKSISESIQILIVADNISGRNELLNSVNGIIPSFFDDNAVLALINSHLKTKQKIDKLTLRNTDMAESLYRLNVLYNTSSQFAGTLDTKELLSYMTEGLERSLSFDIACNISFGFEQEPVLIINSLYDLSEELMNALKFRAVLNYKSLFESKDIPFEIDDTKLKIIKNIKNPHEKFTFSIFQYDNLFAPIDLGDEFFGCIEIFRKKSFSTDDAAYFQTIVRQVSLPLKSAGLYREIMEKNFELEKLERIKSDFISIVSHELRTPLTPIKNALSILSSGRCGSLGENAVKFIDMAKRNVTNLTGIINDILDINKIEAGKMVFNYEKMNIHSVIENIKNNYDYVAKENEIEFVVNECDNLPDIYGDSQRLEQVLRNLVSNAIKFTPKGKKITVCSELKNSNDIKTRECFAKEISNLHGNYIVVSVVDEGIGIKEENLVKAFEQFTQIENSLTRKVGGTGLGLPIAKQLIKAHKGAIWCDSEEEKGSTFSFAIPVSVENSEHKVVQKEMV
jgi:signal transduction histidine kinase